jgi:periplasmic protein CpxP/Spy
MLKKGILITTVIVTLAGAIAVTVAKSNLSVYQVFAQAPRPRQGWLKQLGLTPEQTQQIKQVRQQSKDKITEKKQALEKTKQEMQTLMASSAPAETLRAKYNQLKAQRQELADIQFENTLLIREVLNLEQRKKFTNHIYKKSRKP